MPLPPLLLITALLLQLSSWYSGATDTPHALFLRGTAALLLLIEIGLCYKAPRYAGAISILLAAIGVRLLNSAFPIAPVPAIAWARDNGIAGEFSFLSWLSSARSADLCGIVLWAGALGSIKTRARKSALLALAGAILVVAALLTEKPYMANVLKPSTSSSSIPVWTETGLQQQEWKRVIQPPAPMIRRLSELSQEEHQIAALAQGITTATYGESSYRSLLWRIALWMTQGLYLGRGLLLLGVLLSLPMLLFSPLTGFPIAPKLAQAAQAFLLILAGADLLLGLGDLFLPEGDYTILAFRLCFLGCILVDILSSRQLSLST